MKSAAIRRADLFSRNCPGAILFYRMLRLPGYDGAYGIIIIDKKADPKKKSILNCRSRLRNLIPENHATERESPVGMARSLV